MSKPGAIDRVDKNVFIYYHSFLKSCFIKSDAQAYEKQSISDNFT